MRFFYKLFFKFLLVLLIIALFLPFYIKDKNGKPLLTYHQLNLPDFSKYIPSLSLPDFGKIFNFRKEKNDKPVLILSREKDHKNSLIYKWKDDNHVWHFSDSCPDGKTCISQIMPGIQTSEKHIPEFEPPETEPNDHNRTTSEKENPEHNLLDTLPDLNFPLSIPYQDAINLKKESLELKETIEKKYQDQENELRQLPN